MRCSEEGHTVDALTALAEVVTGLGVAVDLEVVTRVARGLLEVLRVRVNTVRELVAALGALTRSTVVGSEVNHASSLRLEWSGNQLE